MRLKAITPLHVTPDELNRRQDRYNRLSPPGVTIDLFNLPDGPDVPRTFDRRAGIIASEYFVYAEGMRTDPRRYDGIFLDCVLDPALAPLSADTGLPVFGPLRLSLGLMRGLGQRFAVVCRNRPIAEAMREKVTAYGCADLLAEVPVLDVGFQAVAENDQWNAAMQMVLDRLEEKGGVPALINGCSAVDCARSRRGAVRIVDPVEVALQMIGLAYRGGAQAAGRPASA